MSPVQLTVRVEGDEKVRAGLNRWARTLFPITRDSIKAMMTRALKKAIPYQGGNVYSVRETGGGYVRTGNLGRSYAIHQEGLSTRIEGAAYRNGQEYGGYVVGDAEGRGQAGVHVGRWVPLRQAVDSELEALTGEIDDKVQASAGAAGL